MKKIWHTIVLSVAFCQLSTNQALSQSWPTPTEESKPGTRWWWLGSAVDKENLKWNLNEYANHNIGAVEITPLYGVQGNQKNNIDFLSDKWFEMLRFTQEQGKKNGIEIDMATGTGWPFGGPWVPLKESACRVIFVEKTIDKDGVWTTVNGYKGLQPDKASTEVIDISLSAKDAKNAELDKVMLYADGKAIDVTSYVKDNKLTVDKSNPLFSNISPSNSIKIIAVYIKYGVMKVKRAAPGGEGLVIDHFNHNAVANYLHHIEEAFERTHTPYPHTFFNDSYEVSEGNWTPLLFKEFENRRGYKLEEHLPELISHDAKILSDYRETLGDLVLENFTEQWTAWAHAHGAITRNQAHGSPANLIDCYAAVDIPEIEGFGLSDFGIKGLRQDPGKTRKNDSDFSMLKYAPSAAHITGKPYTSSETFTWLTEHFRTSLSQLKPDIDLMFCAGVNHMFFHGTCYSPKNDTWPGWKFYASIDMSPTNSIWRDAPFFMEYVERCQSFLQMGQPDNDFLVYLPIRDMWKQKTGKLLMQFSIHAMGKLAPDFIKTILDIDKAGFDCDYISEKYILSTTYVNGMLQTEAGTRYKGLIIPGSGEMPENVKRHIDELIAKGAKIIYGTDKKDMAKIAKPEEMRTNCSLKTIRRSNNNGYHYFIANLTPNDVHQRVKLAVPYKSALWFNPLNGNIYQADINSDGIDICLRSGESIILQTFNERIFQTQDSEKNETISHKEIKLNGPWTLSFVDEKPEVNESFKLKNTQTWETLSERAGITMGTGVYSTKFKMTKKDLNNGKWKIDLGDVRESARVYINDKFIGCAWAVPFILEINDELKAGENAIRIEVTNLPANRIADLDRKGIKWRKMEEINVVDINYKKTLYDTWEPVPSGLASEVRLFNE